MDILLKQQLEEAGYEGEFTLESLIEACGEDFETLERLGEGGDFEWYATMRSYNDGERVYGKTPTKAVAKIWLELSKDKSLKKE